MSRDQTPDTQPNASAIELAIPVSDRVQIHSVLLLETRAKRSSDDRFSQGGFVLRHDFAPLGVERQETPCSIAVKLSFALHSVRDDEIEADPVLTVEAVICLVYLLSSLDGLDDRNLAAFAQTNGIYNAWPYWREFVQSTTVRMGLPPVTAPVFRFPQPQGPPNSSNEGQASSSPASLDSGPDQSTDSTPN